jgi:TatD DNase family protein
VETDSPFLAPVPMRGKKCEPFMVKHTALKLAEVLGKSFEEIEDLTTANAKACFRI